ncbi:MAG: DUF4179 domain-containing protein [Clostridiales bacterium]|nr:DUF4179 domain-containing protein [Clostridiales bacterium]
MSKAFYDFKIDPADIKNRVNKTLNADLRERRLYMRYKILKTAVIAAAVTALTAVSVFAASPAGQEVISSIVSYFQNDKASQITSMEALAEYNEEIGKSVSKNGYTLTLDNVAADDNFIHVFYTISSQSTPFFEGEDPRWAAYYGTVGPQMGMECVINDTLAGYGTNNNKHDGYFADNYTYKGVCKYNAVLMPSSDIVKVELYGDIGFYKENPIFNKLYTDSSQITDEEREKIWYIKTEVNKSKVRVESVTREINAPFWGGEVEKAVFSPFGNQLVIATPESVYENILPDSFAMFDEKGTCLDVLNAGFTRNDEGISRNAFEFLKADKNTRQLTFVPLIFHEHGDVGTQIREIGTYPIEYKISDYSKVVVTDVRISDGMVEIDYYKDGFVMYDPGFVIMNEKGENAEPGGKLGCTLYHDVHYETNSYTARYEYEKYADDGRPIPPDESVSEQALKAEIAKIGVYEQSYIALDYDNAVTVDLK